LGFAKRPCHQTKYIDDKLTAYSFIGVGRDDGKTKGEYSPVFYKREFFKLISDSTIWLSETPERVSVGWDASMERICTFGRFLHIPTNKEIIVMNTHFDHLGTEARKKSALLILKTIRELEITNLPIILCGDFNATPDEQPIKYLTEYFYSQNCKKPLIKGEKGTFTGFSPEVAADKRIDYIFCRNLISKRYLHIANRTKDGRYISDHLPVFLTVRL
jgi:endonuclease/exonuclease/phosphatase family metal-dependent hydrolase